MAAHNELTDSYCWCQLEAKPLLYSEGGVVETFVLYNNFVFACGQVLKDLPLYYVLSPTVLEWIAVQVVLLSALAISKAEWQCVFWDIMSCLSSMSHSKK